MGVIYNNESGPEGLYPLEIYFKEEKERDKWEKYGKEGLVRLVKWTEVLWEPVEDDNGEDIIRFLSEMPEDGEEVIMTDGKNIWMNIWEDAWGFESTEVTLRRGRLFWMSFPEPYKVEEGK